MSALSRRKLLKATGWIAGGLTVLFSLRSLGSRASAVAPTIIFPDADSASAWIQIRSDGACVFFLPRVEMDKMLIRV